jgi:hypothetical protein
MAPFSDPKCSSLGSREFAAPSPDLLQRPRLRNSRRASGNLRNSNVGVHPPAAPSAGIGNASVTIIPASIAWFLIDLTGAPQRALRPTQRSTNARAWRQRDVPRRVPGFPAARRSVEAGERVP